VRLRPILMTTAAMALGVFAAGHRVGRREPRGGARMGIVIFTGPVDRNSVHAVRGARDVRVPWAADHARPGAKGRGRPSLGLESTGRCLARIFHGGSPTPDGPRTKGFDSGEREPRAHLRLPSCST